MLALLSGVVSRADEKSENLLRKLAATLDGYPSYEVKFTARMDGEFDNIPGRYVVCGDCYRIEVNGMEVYSDGKIRESYNPADNEVTIDVVDPNDRTILANPTKVFNFLDDQFQHQYKGQQTVDGRTCDMIGLLSRQPNEAYDAIELWIDAVTGLPVQLDYQVAEASAQVEVKVGQIKRGEKLPLSYFRFDRESHPGVEVIDFR